MTWLLFSISMLSICTILFLSFVKRFQFWPPPAAKTWQHRVFLVLFRTFLYPLIGLSLIEFEVVSGPWARLLYSVGGALMLTGFGLAVWITLRMGWRNAFGEKLGLQTTGWFAVSRNPVYVATWLGMIGWGIVLQSVPVTMLLIVWAVLYFLAPFKEEVWLEAQYGDIYRKYKTAVRRFI